MNIIKQKYSATYRAKGSKFTGILFPAGSEEAFDEELAAIKSRYPDATHHCYAWRINPSELREFAQDDGEPGGTAGLPILNRLKSAGLVNCALVAVRYFGGTELGKTGLIEAYGHTAELCINKAKTIGILPSRHFRISYSYDLQNHIEKLVNAFGLVEKEATYLEEVTLELACPLSRSDELTAKLENMAYLGIFFEKTGSGYIER